MNIYLCAKQCYDIGFACRRKGYNAKTWVVEELYMCILLLAVVDWNRNVDSATTVV